MKSDEVSENIMSVVIYLRKEELHHRARKGRMTCQTLESRAFAYQAVPANPLSPSHAAPLVAVNQALGQHASQMHLTLALSKKATRCLIASLNCLLSPARRLPRGTYHRQKVVQG